MKAAVCVDAVYGGNGGLDTVEAMRRVHRLGFRWIELWSWWDRDIEQIRSEAVKLGVGIHAICTRFVPLTDSTQREAYIRGLEETLDVAARLGCRRVITQVGPELAEVSRAEQHQSVVDGLKACVPMLERAGVCLAVEPLNVKVDHQGYYLSESDEAFEIIRKVGSDHVKLLYDMYHQLVTEDGGDILASMSDNLDQIAYLHAAGYPGRHELDKGEVNYDELIEALRTAGYNDMLTLEYMPRPGQDPTDGLRRFSEAYAWMLPSS
ncbi:TIM barrel protein [Paenibacillus marinisediminis]